MATKKKTVFSADMAQLEQIERLIADKVYRNISEFMREAIAEKLARLRASRVAEEVARYCAACHADEDEDLIASQSFDEAEPPPRKGRRRAQG